MTPPEELVMYIVVRTDLAMPVGKIAAQVGHAVQLTMRAVEKNNDPECLSYGPTQLQTWERGSYAKIVLGVKSLAALDSLAEDLARVGILHAVVVDEGRNHVETGTKTCVGIAPMTRAQAKAFVGRLKLL